MHVIDLLSSDMFGVEIGGRAGSIADVFPHWQEHDRFGILIESPLGGLGATHLIQIAITSFYDVKPVRRQQRKVYPEIYAFHIGRDFGAHAGFDFWPGRREVMLLADHREILDAINDRGITRLAIPDRPNRALVHRPKEVDAALDRMRTAIVYGATGRVDDADFSIVGQDRRTEVNPRKVIRPITITADMVQRLTGSDMPIKEIDPDYRDMVLRRLNAIEEADRVVATQRRESNAAANGLVKETYRFIGLEEALYRL